MRLNKFLINERITMSDKPSDFDDISFSDLDDGDRTAAREVAKLIKENCQKFLKECEGLMMYRGYKGGGGGWSERTVRTDRYPKDTPQEIHDELNNEFEAAFDWPVRSGVFCTGDLNFALGYGNAITIWPKDGYKYAWSTSYRDLYVDANFENAGYGEPDDYMYEEWEREWEDEYGDPSEDGDYENRGNGEFIWDGNYTGEDNRWDAVNHVLNKYVWPDWLDNHSEEIEKAKEWADAIDDDNEEEAERLKKEWEEEFPYADYDIEDYNFNDSDMEDEMRIRVEGEVVDEEHGYFEWDPEISKEDYIDRQIEWYQEEYAGVDVEGIVNEYQDDDLVGAIESGNEICVGPGGNNYYAVDMELSSYVWDIVYDLDDTQQLKFDFVFKPNPKIDKGIWKGNRFFAGFLNKKTKSIDYIMPYRDLIKNKSALTRKPYDHEMNVWQSAGLQPTRLAVPRQVIERYKAGDSFFFVIPSNVNSDFKNVKYEYSFKFGSMSDAQLSAMLSLVIKLAT